MYRKYAKDFCQPIASNYDTFEPTEYSVSKGVSKNARSLKLQMSKKKTKNCCINYLIPKKVKINGDNSPIFKSFFQAEGFIWKTYVLCDIICITASMIIRVSLIKHRNLSQFAVTKVS